MFQFLYSLCCDSAVGRKYHWTASIHCCGGRWFGLEVLGQSIQHTLLLGDPGPVEGSEDSSAVIPEGTLGKAQTQLLMQTCSGSGPCGQGRVGHGTAPAIYLT